MSQLLGSFGPVSFPVYPPAGKENSRTNSGTVSSPELVQIHGFNAASKQSFHFISERQVVFPAGALCTILYIDSGVAPSFYRGHTQWVTCVAHAAETKLCASGQRRHPSAKFAEVLLWDPVTLTTKGSFRYHQADIEVIGFTQGGEVLVSIGADRDHTLAMWSLSPLRKKAPIAVSSAFSGGAVSGLLPMPGDTGQYSRFATYGSAHVKFWRFPKLSPNLASRRGAFGPEGAPQRLTCATWIGANRLVAGGSAGEIFFFEGTKAIRCLRMKHFAVQLLTPLHGSLLAVYSNGVSSLISDSRTVDLDVADVPGAPDPRFQTSVIGGSAWRQRSVLLATQTHLMHLELPGGIEDSFCRVLLEQPSKRVTSVCAHPTEPKILTGALDGSVRFYQSEGYYRPLPEKNFMIASGVTCLAMSESTPATSSWLAVGCEDSTLCILGESALNYVFRRKLSSVGAGLTCAQFSTADHSGVCPLWLAVGTEDGCIHTLKFKDSSCHSSVHTGPEIVTKFATLRGHAAPLFEISFASTLPCTFLQSVDVAGQMLSFDVPTSRRFPSVSLVRDADFIPWVCPLGFPVMGCWASYSGKSRTGQLPPRRFCEVPERSLIAVSEVDTFSISVFPYPCPTAPVQDVPRLGGPAALVSRICYSECSDVLVVSSDTATFFWVWPDRPPGEGGDRPPFDAAARSPLRPLGTQLHHPSVVFETPEGRKRAVGIDDELGSSPAAISPAKVREKLVKENFDMAMKQRPEIGKLPFGSGVGDEDIIVKARREDVPVSRESPVSMGSADVYPEQPQRPRSPVRQFIEDDGLPGAAFFSSQKPDSSKELPFDAEEDLQAPLPPPSYAAADPLPPPRQVPADSAPPYATTLEEYDAQPLPPPSMPSPADFEIEHGVPIGLDNGSDHLGVREFLEKSKRRREFVSPKIGAQEAFSRQVLDARRVRSETMQRAQGILERQRFDAVGQLLHAAGENDELAFPVIAPSGAQRETSAGRFMCRVNNAGRQYEVEVQLPGGRLQKVTRNPYQRTLTFYGEITSKWGLMAPSDRGIAEDKVEDRLTVHIPRGFDVTGPLQTEKNFDDGRCIVTVPKSSTRRAWVQEEDL